MSDKTMLNSIPKAGKTNGFFKNEGVDRAGLVPIFGYMKYLIFLSFLFLRLDVYSQNSRADTITFDKRSGRFYFQGQKLRNRELEQKLVQYPETADLYFKHERKSTAAGFVILGALACGIIDLTKKNTPFFTPYSIPFYAGSILGVHLSVRARRPLVTAASLYNKRVLQ